MDFTNDINAVDEQIALLTSLIQDEEEKIRFKKSCLDGYKLELLALKYYKESLIADSLFKR